ncbi:cyclic nucleotide-gated ion channel 1 [Citrus sinensis]|uniref:Cyclic nucleotide-gated ion channel 1 n=1 Tax=Citrus sinensis TaxID=2711 RepID=A0ACB8HSM0_CITSI|nr:cyclic nucleotide-gated ion channel 1 [Citrus sinensis]
MLCATAVSLDFWFFYIPVVNDDRKCISLDAKLAITACLLRFLFDFLYSIPIALQMLTDLVSTDYVSYGENDSYVTHTLRMIVDLVGGNNSRRNISHKRVCEYLSPSLLVDLLAIFPLPQLVILFIIPQMRGSKILDAMDLLKYSVFIQFVPRIVRIYPWSVAKLAEATWVIAAFNLLLYMFAGHVFGALWYFSAIERETECWKKACMNDTGCNRGSFDCDDCIGDYKFLDGVCPTKIRNTSIHDFGIFQDALQSGIVEVTDFPQKFLHCFRWGLRNLSCIGQNLQTSSNSWENFFVILVTICGLLLLLFLFGNMQMYLESKALKSKEMSVRMQEINEWMPIEKLSQSVQQQLKIYQRYVEEFKKLNEAILDALCDCVKMTFYFKHTHISLDGDPIYEMLFLVRGKIWIYSSKERINGSANTDYFRDNNNMTKMDHLADGDFWGEELVAWALYNRSLSNIPVSTRTVQTLTDVEGFVLTAEDLKSVFTEHEISGSTKLNLKHSNIQAACVIQLAWRRHRTRRKSSL